MKEQGRGEGVHTRAQGLPSTPAPPFSVFFLGTDGLRPQVSLASLGPKRITDSDQETEDSPYPCHIVLSMHSRCAGPAVSITQKAIFGSNLGLTFMSLRCP